MAAAEKKCASVSSHHLDSWSPELIQAMATKRYWKSRVTVASKLPMKIGFVKAIKIYRDILTKYHEAEAIYFEKRKKSKAIRIQHLEDRAEEVAKEKGTKAAQEIKNLIVTEKERDKNARIKRVVKPTKAGGLSTLLIPAITEYQRPHPRNFDHHKIEFIWERIEYDNGEDVNNWERITDQKQVQSMLLEWQRCHFTQANETPFATQEWREKLKNEEVQEQILDGTFEADSSLPLEARELLNEMKRPNNCIPQIV